MSPDPSPDAQEILSRDKLFNSFIEDFPDNEADLVKGLLANPSILENLIKLLPPAQQSVIHSLLTSAEQVPSQALSLFRHGRFAEAREKFEQSIAIYSMTPNSGSPHLDNACGLSNRRTVALFHNMLANIEWCLGNPEPSKCHHLEALRLSEEVADLDTLVKSILGLGGYYCEAGDYEQGLSCCQKAAELLHGQDDRWQIQSHVLSTLSRIYAGIGQDEEAMGWAEEAVEIARTSKNNNGLATSLNTLGIRQMEAGMLESAIATFREGIQVAQKTSDSYWEAVLLANYARSFLDQPDCDYDEVERLLGRVSELTKATDDLSMAAHILDASGWLSLAKDDIESAVESFTRLVEIQKTIGAFSCQADALLILAMIQKEYLADLTGAIDSCRQGIEILEKIRNRFRKDSHRIVYASSTSTPYAFMIQALLALNKVDEAFEYVERNKSRALLDLLHAPFTAYLAGCKDSGSKSWQRLSALLDEAGEIHSALESFHDPETGGDFPGSEGQERGTRATMPFLERLATVEAEVSAAFAELAKFDTETLSFLRVTSATVTETKEHLDDETGTLSLYQTESTLHLFLFGRNGTTKVSEVAIDGDAAATIVSGLLRGILNTRHLPVHSHDVKRLVRQPLAHLFDTLIRPIRAELSCFRRIIISPHLFWHFFPFHALLDNTTGQYLCDQLEVGYCPSASILRECRQKLKTGRDRALILSRGSETLPHVDEEAVRVAAAFGQGESSVYQGQDAYFSRSASGEAFDVIHLACHGFFNDSQPLLSGLDLPPGPAQDRQTFVGDLFGAQLDSSLVTLSACESGLSEFTQADELIGLSRSILHAGAAATMLSLWQVADASTCELMENFYWHYARNRQAKTRGLQLAMQAVKAREEYAHPFYWAPFVIMGDWR
ncbi:MAG: CHAT domain-containing protein [Deltaproteobacteria bacterium]|nr:CHAT domain-containing protein [Deltaproteobacteria bacterium]